MSDDPAAAQAQRKKGLERWQLWLIIGLVAAIVISAGIFFWVMFGMVDKFADPANRGSLCEKMLFVEAGGPRAPGADLRNSLEQCMMMAPQKAKTRYCDKLAKASGLVTLSCTPGTPQCDDAVKAARAYCGLDQ